MKAATHRVLHRFGLDVVRYDGRRFVARRRIEVIELSRVNVVLDVGAGVGQFGGWLRSEGYGGRIISFEPVPETFEGLRRRSASDPAWTTFELALGDHDGQSVVHVAGNLWSSSLVPMTHRHEEAAPLSAYVRDASVQVARLDSLSVLGADDRAYLKIDTQGAECAVLDGAEGAFDQIVAVEIELSLVELYEGQELLASLYEQLSRKGFALVWLGDAIFRDPVSDEILAVDGIFVRGR
jgi:FkbM family methyltransferase